MPAGASKAESKKNKKRKLDSSHLDTLTGDERMAVELYHAIKKTRKESSEGEEEEEGEEEKQMENTYNNSGDALVDAEEEKRAITYQIAKNKVCYISTSVVDLDPDSMVSLDLDPVSLSGTRRAKMTEKKEKR